MEEKPYRSLNEYYRSIFGRKAAKISLDGGFTCPNRMAPAAQGAVCSAVPAAVGILRKMPLFPHRADCKRQGADGRQMEKPCLYRLFPSLHEYLCPRGEAAAEIRGSPRLPRNRGISIATRADCLPADVLSLLAELNKKQTSGGLGLQTADAQSAAFIRRGYPLSVFTQAVYALAERNIPVVVHIILGLPGESRETVLRTIDYLNRLPIQGVKLQLLHVLSDSDLADLYRAGEYTPLEKEEYLTLVGDCIAHLRADIVMHRLTGDGDKNTLLAPLWSLRKRDVLNHLHRYLRENHIRQGMSCKIDLSVIYNKPKDVL